MSDYASIQNGLPPTQAQYGAAPAPPRERVNFGNVLQRAGITPALAGCALGAMAGTALFSRAPGPLWILGAVGGGFLGTQLGRAYAQEAHGPGAGQTRLMDDFMSFATPRPRAQPQFSEGYPEAAPQLQTPPYQASEPAYSGKHQAQPEPAAQPPA